MQVPSPLSQGEHCHLQRAEVILNPHQMKSSHEIRVRTEVNQDAAMSLSSVV